MSIDMTMLRGMRHSPLYNYVIPGLTSWLIGDPSAHGSLRYFYCSRDHQEPITPHSHRFDFQCWVLKGSVTNRVWEKAWSKGDAYMRSILHYQGVPGAYTRKELEMSLYRYADTVYEEGAWYSMKAEEIHSIHFSQGAEVLFFQGPNVSDKSVILEPFVNGETVPTFKVEPWMFKKGDTK